MRHSSAEDECPTVVTSVFPFPASLYGVYCCSQLSFPRESNAMHRSIGNTIGDSLNLSLAYARRMLTGVTPLIFARFATPGNLVIESNHPAFVYGHLSLYPTRIMEQLGGDSSSITPPAKFQEVFSRDAICVDDPTGTIYPVQEDVTDTFFKGYEACLELLRSTPDEVFQVPNPMPGRMTELFPSLGSMHAFYVGGHMMMHLGQISAWRRMQGLGAA